MLFFFFQAEDGIRDRSPSRGLGDVYKRQGMDSYNLRNMKRMLPNDTENKIHLLLDWSDNPRDIADPWYTGDFDKTYNDVLEGCTALLKEIKKEL